MIQHLGAVTAPTLKDLLSRTEQGREILKKLSGAEPELLGKFLPGLMKPLKKIGKITRGITTVAAKVTAAAFGIPPGAIDALAKLDPTAHSALLDKLSQTKKSQIAAAAKKATAQAKKAIKKAIKPGAKPGAQQKKTSKMQTVYIAAAAAVAALAGFAFLGKKKRG